MKNWLRAYTEQKRLAGKRNINWNFTYESWLSWWGNDIENRGRKKGQLVMARYGDTGPYSPENVRKATAEENIIESHLGKKRSPEVGLKISKANKGKIQTEEHKQKNRDANLGKKQSVETIQKRRSKLTGILKGSQPKVICPHCGKIGGNNIMMRHHFDRCKTLFDV